MIEHLTFLDGPKRVGPFSHAVKSDEYLSLLTGSLAASEAAQNFGNGKIANKNLILKSIKHMMK